MKIAAVHVHLLDVKLDQAFESASMRFDRRQHCLVEIVCEDGTIGWGECLGPAVMNAAIVKAFAPHILGRDPLATEVLWLELYHRFRDQGQRGLTMTALSGIDIALWDIKGKHFGTSISRLMGGRFNEELKAYATGSFRKDGVDPLTDIIQETAGYIGDGFHAVKIKIGFDVDKDIEIIRAVRETIGPNRRLMIDGNHGYDAIEACAVGQAVAPLGIDWFEEPVIPEQLDAYRAVRAGQPIPVAGGETWHGRHGMREAIASRAVDIIQPDICGCGGFSEARRIADIATLHGVRVVPHVWGTGVAIAAALQFMAALAPDPVRRDPRRPILEFDRTHNPYRQAVLMNPLEHERGIVTIPDGPGLGIEINRQALADFALKETFL